MVHYRWSKICNYIAIISTYHLPEKMIDKKNTMRKLKFYSTLHLRISQNNIPRKSQHLLSSSLASEKLIKSPFIESKYYKMVEDHLKEVKNIVFWPTEDSYQDNKTYFRSFLNGMLKTQNEKYCTIFKLNYGVKIEISQNLMELSNEIYGKPAENKKKIWYHYRPICQKTIGRLNPTTNLSTINQY